MEDYLGMADSLTSSITRVLMESHDTDLSGKFSLFTLYSDNSSVLHIFEDEETFEAMKYKFSSDDNIKRLGASRLPENTTFKKLSESIERKFDVPRETISVRTHDPMPKEQPQPKKVVNEMRKAPMPSRAEKDSQTNQDSRCLRWRHPRKSLQSTPSAPQRTKK